MRNKKLLALALCVLVALMTLGCYRLMAPGSAKDWSSVVQQIRPAVVKVHVGMTAEDGTPKELFAGHGFVISSDGTIVTAAHVIKTPVPVKGLWIRVEFSNGVEFPVVYSSVSRDHDIAILKIKEVGLDTLEIETGELSEGTPVMAMGGNEDLTWSISDGVISDVSHSVDAIKRVAMSISATAHLPMGYSGGPLVNGHGRVVGMSSFRTIQPNEMYFYVPAPLLRTEINKLIRGLGQERTYKLRN